jgi:hypothetical protein
MSIVYGVWWVSCIVYEYRVWRMVSMVSIVSMVYLNSLGRALAINASHSVAVGSVD